MGNGVRVITWAVAMLMPIPPRLPLEHPLHRKYLKWRRRTIRYLFTSLSPYIRQSNTLLITTLEDLRGMAMRRGLSEIEYARIWRYAIGSNLDRQPLINKGHYRILIGRSGSIVIATDPRDTSNMCFLHNAEGREVRVKEYSDRTIECNGKLRLNRDLNAALNIAIEGLRTFAWHHTTLTIAWQEATKTTRPGDWARAPGGIEGRGLGVGPSPTPRPQ